MLPLNVPTSRFCERLINLNNLLTRKFAQWAFHPGMLFQSRERWWGNGGFRHTPHEGIDLCLFLDQSGSMQVLNMGAQIPAMFPGWIKSVINDYLGKTIFIAHDIYDGTAKQLYTIYGHIEPVARFEREAVLEDGDCLGCISRTENKQLPIFPHVHISVAWIPTNFPSAHLNWQILNDSPDITLLNPLDVLSCNFTTIGKSAFPATLPF